MIYLYCLSKLYRNILFDQYIRTMPSAGKKRYCLINTFVQCRLREIAMIQIRNAAMKEEENTAAMEEETVTNKRLREEEKTPTNREQRRK